MHTEHHLEALRSAEAEALEGHVATPDRVIAGEHPRPPAHPLGEASGYPPNCVHGMNSLADGRYERALGRLRRG
jgi:hypothetical protein